jgi:hypothetical protein
MANSIRGEATITIGGKPYDVVMNLGALARLATALDVEGFTELQERLAKFRLADMPVVIDAVLKANGHDVEMAQIEKMDPLSYITDVIPAIFRNDGKANGAGGAEANPPKGRAKK